MKIAIDVMSGDKSPVELIRGCVKAAQETEATIVIIGNEQIIREELANHTLEPDKIEIIESEDIIGMCESPAKACRQKRDSSVVIAARSIKENLCEAFFSPGNTGATLTSALLEVGRLKGVKRPAIASLLPSRSNRPLYILDAGANVDCIPKYLLQFALMGETYYKCVHHVKEPRVGLLSIGEEESKGNSLTFHTHQLLKKIPFNYIGNIESRNIFMGDVDIVICDGFIGNTMLKEAEGLGKFLFSILKEEIKQTTIRKIGAALLIKAFKKLRSLTDASEYGGMPLLGVKGSVLIGHGSSDARAVKSAVKVAIAHIASDVTAHIEESIQRWGN